MRQKSNRALDEVKYGVAQIRMYPTTAQKTYFWRLFGANRWLWNQIKDLGLLGKTLDTPLIGGEAFYTDYGYHKIAVLSASEKVDLPTADEVKLHRALALYNAVVTKIAEVDKNIES